MKQYITVLLIPLIPTIALFIFFENTAEVTYTEHALAIKVTGAAAFYIALFLLSLKYYDTFFDPLYRIRKAIVGKWTFETTGYDDISGNGQAEITIDQGNLTINGALALPDHEHPGQKRRYAWDATEIYLTKDKITWFFNFPRMKREGVARLNLHHGDKGSIDTMIGEWGVAGIARGGSISMTRVLSHA